MYSIPLVLDPGNHHPPASASASASAENNEDAADPPRAPLSTEQSGPLAGLPASVALTGDRPDSPPPDEAGSPASFAQPAPVHDHAPSFGWQQNQTTLGPIGYRVSALDLVWGEKDIAQYTPDEMCVWADRIRQSLKIEENPPGEYFSLRSGSRLVQWIDEHRDPAVSDPSFDILPWSGNMNLHTLLRACCNLSLHDSYRMVENREHYLPIVKGCLQQAVTSWNGQLRLHDETFKALMGDETGHEEALTPMRLIAAVRSVYLRSPQEAAALQNALGRCFEHEPRDLSTRVPEFTGWLDVLTEHPESTGLTPGLGLRSMNFLIPGVALPLTVSQCNALAREILREALAPARTPHPEIIRRFTAGLVHPATTDPAFQADRANIDTFMQRIPETIWYRKHPQWVLALLGELRQAMDQDPEFAKRIAQVAETYAVTCDDNILLGFDKMRMLLQMQLTQDFPGKVEWAKLLHKYAVVEQAGIAYGEKMQGTRDPSTGQLRSLDLVEIVLKLLTSMRAAGCLDDFGYTEFNHYAFVSAWDVEALQKKLENLQPRQFYEYLAKEEWLNSHLSTIPEFVEQSKKIEEQYAVAMEEAFDNRDPTLTSQVHVNNMVRLRNERIATLGALIGETIEKRLVEPTGATTSAHFPT